MKLILFLAITIFSWLIPPISNHSGQPFQHVSSLKKSDTVWICNGKYATKYHKYEDCRGLNNCKSTITSIEKSEAIKKERTECDVCY
jgi:hypothetical protein